MLTNQEKVLEVLRKHGITDATEVLCGLLWLLHEQHHVAIGFGTASTFSDGLDRLTGAHATTVAESLRNYARVTASRYAQNAKAHRDAGKPQEAAGLDIASSRIQPLADLLEYYLPVWNFEGNELMEARRRQQEKDLQDPDFTPLAPVLPQEPTSRLIVSLEEGDMQGTYQLRNLADAVKFIRQKFPDAVFGPWSELPGSPTPAPVLTARVYQGSAEGTGVATLRLELA